MTLRLNIAALLIGLPALVQARISGVYTCNDLLTKAEVVVKGEVLSVSDNGPVKVGLSKISTLEADAARLEANEVVAQFRIDRVIVGNNLPKTIPVKFYRIQKRSRNSGLLADLNTKDYAILFLRKNGDSYSLLDLDHGKLAASRNTGRNPASRHKEGLQDELKIMLSDSDPQSVATGMKCISELGGSGEVVGDLMKLKGSKDFSIRCRSLALLARTGDAAAIKEMIGLLNADPLSRNERVNYPQLRDFVDAIEVLPTLTNPDLTVAIAPLLQHKSVGIRRATAHSLRKMKDKRMIPHLIAALDDGDKFVRYDAYMGMCEMIRPDGCVSSIIFNAEPEKYISEWKIWAEKNK